MHFAMLLQCAMNVYTSKYFLFTMSNAVLDTSVYTIDRYNVFLVSSWYLHLILACYFLLVSQVLEHDGLQN